MAEAFKFHQVYAEEIEAINARRERLKRKRVVLKSAGKDREGNPLSTPSAESNLVGLALSGGGVRSASFCLGALQALDDAGALKKIDYLSTVSGGGYIGTSTVAAMTTTRDDAFPFPSELKPDETPALQHVRDHSNYLFPRGKIDIFNNLAIYLRGLIANVILILPALLLAAAFTIWSNPTVNNLSQTDFHGEPLPGVIIEVKYFGITLHVMLVIGVLLAVWAFWRSFSGRYRDVGAGWTLVTSAALLALLIVAFCELQPAALDGMFKLAKSQYDPESQLEFRAAVIEAFKYLSATLAAFSAVIGFMAPLLSNILKTGLQSPTWKARLMRVVAKAAIYLAAAAVPLVLWVAYLYLSFWGICDVDCNRSVADRYWAPGWILAIATWIFGTIGVEGTPVKLYLLVGAVLLLLGLLLTPNANSLHRLYRDRLSKAFLFNPREREVNIVTQIESRLAAQQKKKPDNEVRKRARDLAPLDALKLSAVRHEFAPYQLINTALNIGGSKYANQRGRNADFFVFTPKFSGSKATGFVRTADLEDKVKDLDLAAAMAISGAAASSNMGGNTIKALSPTLAMLNIRLGFWLPNPLSVAADGMASRYVSLVDQLYFVREMFGQLDERSGLIYLTDGGHVENLGVYELLRRRCQLIIAVDAEADPEMSFNSFVALQRHALIDLGVLVSLPWSKIRDATDRAATEIAETGGKPPSDAAQGPHCALGEIKYPDGGFGILLYIKSSLTGDENDYIVDYKRRFPDFPHETTADQLFSEEQFEVYRALGFHVTRRMLRGTDEIALPGRRAAWRGRSQLLTAARRILLARR